MLRLGTLLIISILAVTAIGADFAGSFPEYRNSVRHNLGLALTNTSYVSDSTLNQFIREAVIAVNPVIRGKKQTWMFTATYRQATYTLDTLLMSISSVEWVKNDSIKSLLYVSRETFYQKHVDPTQDKKGFDRRPSYYDWIDGQVILYPSPTVNGDSFRVVGTGRIPSVAAVDSLRLIPQTYREPIVQYATWLAARSRSHPMTETFRRDALASIQMVNESLNKRKNPSDSGK